MTSHEPNPMDALAGLLEERRRYEGWLDQLDARRSDAPSHVVDRVRADYRSRLDGVTQKLRDRAEELTLTAGTLRDRIAALRAEEATRRDERAELELRAMVGELASHEAEHAMRSCDDAVGLLSQERGALEGELTRITEVLDLVVPAPPAAPADPSPVSDPAAEGEPEASPAAHPAVSALETSSLSAGEPSAMDELAFLRSVVAPVEEAAAAPAESAERAAEAPTAAADASGELLPPPVLSAPRRPVTPLSTSIPTTRDPFASTAKASMLTPGSIPSFLKDMPTEQVKTLKCQECGTMNYPTEWYCERCGGELAAM